MVAFKNGLHEICNNVVDTNKKVIVRILFGNTPGMPVNITKLMEEFTSHLPQNAHKKLKLWVGSWRKGTSWNHSKIIAIDGKHLWTGGHNFWDRHYLKAKYVLYCDVFIINEDCDFEFLLWGFVVVLII